MKIPHRILESEEVVEYLIQRGLVKQYQKSKMYILEGISSGTCLKERQPKSSGIRSFRVNRQYRAIGYFSSREENEFIVSYIDDHQ